MKVNVIITYMILLATSASYAQEFKKFKIGVGLGLSMASGHGSSGGMLVTVEPAYRINDQFSIGLRLESTAVKRGVITPILGAEYDIVATNSYTLNGQYYFTKGSLFRPFIGVGFGIYDLKAVRTTIVTNNGTTGFTPPTDPEFGFYPRVGFDFWHKNIAYDYNFIPTTKI